MDHFEYRQGTLHCEQVPLPALAQRFGTPLYVYSQATLLEHYQRLAEAFAPVEPLICYSVKCCSNLALLRVLRAAGSGFDVVSGGELYRALRAGADPRSIVFAGAGKTDAEIDEALAAGVGLLNIESVSELEQLAALAEERQTTIRAALRVNPDVDAHTHAYTTTGKKETKFGVDLDRAAGVFARFGRHPYLKLCGLHLHIGSPVNDVEPYRLSLERVLAFIGEQRAAGYTIDTLDVGGGFGAYYQGGEAPPATAYARVMLPLLQGAGLRVILEPGRSIAANAGLLLARVLHTKESGQRRFVITDASMNELIRPALYGSYHFIWPVAAPGQVPPHRGPRQRFDDLVTCDVVGPVCESGDFLAKDRPLPPVKRGDLLGVFSAGAYAMSMASQYNSRPRAAEVLISGDRATLVRRRETYADLIAAEEF